MSADSLPVMTVELSRRIDAAAVRFQAERMEGIAAQAGNPWGVEVTQLDDGGTLLLAKGLSLDWMNTAYGVRTLGACENALGRFARAGIKPRFEVLPGNVSVEIAHRLHKAGLRHSLYHCALYGVPEPPGLAARNAAGVEVKEIGAEDLEEFLDLFLAGFEAPVAIRQGSKGNMRHWIERTSFRLYVATIEDVPAGAAVLFVDGGIGYLAAAATLPSMRGHGVHSAMIRRRIEDAIGGGCDLVTGQADFGSTSQQNMQRAGLQIAYTKAVWTWS